MKKQVKKSLKDFELNQIKLEQMNRLKGGDGDILITEDILDG